MYVAHEIDSILREIISFFFEQGIKHLDAEEKKNEYKIPFSLKIKSYVSETKKADLFRFELILKKRNNNKTSFEIYTKKGSNTPFHPNFKVINGNTPELLLIRKALWVHSSNRRNNTLEALKTMILALQYNHKYLDLHEDLGNKKARNWYLVEKDKDKDKNKFPTDTFLNPLSQKKFVLGKPEVKKVESRLKIKENKKFEIKSKTDYQLQEISIPKEYFKTDKNLNSICKNQQSDSLLFISEKAKEQIWKHIQWGNMHTSVNEKEQGGILLGQVYIDKEKEIQFAFVEQVVAGKSARGNSTYLEMDHTTWSEMLEEADSIIDSQPEDKTQVIGWYHTHPMGLDVFMSGTDKNTQTRFFNQDWHYAIVLNPHKKIWKAFVGEQALECSGYIISEEEETNRNAIDKNEGIENVKKKDIWEWMIITLLVIVVTIGYGISQKQQIPSINKEPVKTNQSIVKSKKVIVNPKDSTKNDEGINQMVDSIVIIAKKDSINN